jgi:NifB/MoaA-like Fe-S oxidoreductase
VTASGLLGGQDVADAVRDKPRAELVAVPRAMLDSGGRLTLDGWDLERLAGSVGTTVKAGVGPADLVAAITGSSEDEDGPGEEGLACAG